MSTPSPLSYGLDTPLNRVMARMLACVCNALVAAGRPLCDCAFHHGSSAPPMDAWCNCDCNTDPAVATVGGQAWVRWVRTDPLSRDLDLERCSPTMVQEVVEVGVYRCWPMPQGDGRVPPSSEERNRAAMGLRTDASVMWSALACCPGDNTSDWVNDWEVRPYVAQPIAPQGGCAGAYVMAYVQGVLPGVDVLTQIARSGP